MKTISKNKISFNQPFVSTKGLSYIEDALSESNGQYTQKCKLFFDEKYSFENTFLTSSCTHALEMAAILIDAKEGDEIIIPSYTFVSSANPFVLRGATVVFADSAVDSPNIDADKIEKLITSKTKAIVVVHYGGVACDMNKIMEIANRHHIIVIEDAAHSIDAYYKEQPLGSFGHLSAFSFHDTKNISCGEGGMLVINDESLLKRAELIFEKGTNRAAFVRGDVDKYEWMDIGSSFTMSEITAAYLFSQLEELEEIQTKRKQLWSLYYHLLKPLQDKNYFDLPVLTENSFHNAHLFYIICDSPFQRQILMKYLSESGIPSSFHYSSLHLSPFYKSKYKGEPLVNADKYAAWLLRLPLHYYLKQQNIEFITDKIKSFFE